MFTHLETVTVLSNPTKFGYLNLKDMFEENPDRAETLCIKTEHVYYDYSRQLVNPVIMQNLIKLANEANLKEKIEAMFNGEKINKSEDRAVAHTALRNISNKPVIIDGQDVMPKINKILKKISDFSFEIQTGLRLGYTDESIENIVAIGIGGSFLGPQYLAEACKTSAIEGMNLFFIANIDGAEFIEITKDLDLAKTLFVVISKTFTTSETMKNAQTAKKLMIDVFGTDPKVIEKHFVAVSTATEKVKEFGINPENMFEFWDWVGGRYSSCSAVGGLILSLYLGFDKFQEILDGANWMDEHFRNAPFEQNIPVLCSLLDVWNINFQDLKTRALLPYSKALSKLPAHTQQVEMESNGKEVDINGNQIYFDTGEVIFGEPGTNGQHSFYQLLHQGSQIIPCDFIGFVKACPEYDIPAQNENDLSHHEELMTNFFAQPDALAFGQENCYAAKNFDGNRPSSSILLQELTPFSAGILLALTEHRAVVKGFIWDINSFDQFGVELGKVLGKAVKEQIIIKQNDPEFIINCGNQSTNLMLNAFIKGELPK